MIVSMDNVDIPAHQTHLQAEDGWVGTVIGKDKFNCIAISCPHKTLAKEHVAALVHGPIPRETFTKMRVEPNFISAAAPGTKGDWMKNGCGILRHKAEVRSRAVGVHCCGRGSVISWLAKNIAKPF
jgi:hypothetical protein